MDKFNFLLSGGMRYVLPCVAIFIIATCVISLFRNRPRLHVLAQLIECKDGSIIDIDRWETSIGRSKSNDIVLPLDDVSRYHAVIAKKQKEWVITDTFSKTGVFVNDERVEGSQTIENGDIITIGSTSLKFNCAEAISSQARAQIKSDVRKMAPQGNTNVAYAVLVDVISHKPIYIKKKDVLIGRGAQADIRLPADTISSEHARIHLTSQGWALSDLNSHNGTKLNGRFINQPQLIFDEDMLTFGDKVFIFYEK